MLRLHEGYQLVRDLGLSNKIDEKFPQLRSRYLGSDRATDLVNKKDKAEVFRLICQTLGSQKVNAKFAKRQATTV